MSRIEERFAELNQRDQRALIAYVMAGYPNEEATLATVRGQVRGGADIIELGFPFSDPLADGPAIQNAGTVSLRKGAKTGKFFNMVKRIREETEIPLVLMTYTNILYRRGFSEFIADAKRAGIDGCILPDMSIDESGGYLRAAKDHVDTIFLVSPNTSSARIKRIARASSGFLYLVAVFGTTGVKTGVKRYTLDAIKKVKRQTGGRIPVGIGFGVSTPQDVREYVKAGADAVIVGSAYLKIIEDTPERQLESRIYSFTKQLKKETVPD